MLLGGEPRDDADPVAAELRIALEAVVVLASDQAGGVRGHPVGEGEVAPSLRRDRGDRDDVRLAALEGEQHVRPGLVGAQLQRQTDRRRDGLQEADRVAVDAALLDRLEGRERLLGHRHAHDGTPPDEIALGAAQGGRRQRERRGALREAELLGDELLGGGGDREGEQSGEEDRQLRHRGDACRLVTPCRVRVPSMGIASPPAVTGSAGAYPTPR